MYLYQMQYDIIIIGGGASGFFTAINLAENRPDLKIAILEKGKDVLSKVRVSGGGRCNVTHAEFMPKPLATNYPRGQKELLGPFHSFMTGDTMAWFSERGVALKIEEDRRVFPESDSSQTIIDCFLNETKKAGVKILLKQGAERIEREDELWQVVTGSDVFYAKALVLATGSSPKIWRLLDKLGHKIISAVPSLFTFNIKDERIVDLPGLATPAVVELLDLSGKPLQDERGNRIDRGGSEGPLLITHWGMSGPGILKLSAWGARVLFDMGYDFQIRINWLPDIDFEMVMDILLEKKNDLARQKIRGSNPFSIPKRLWVRLASVSEITEEIRWGDVSKVQLEKLAHELTSCVFRVSGKSTFKEEFVTAGGIDLTEIDFKTFESKLFANLFFVGEVLNIDAVTGGFNFQNAWTGGFIAARSIAEKF